MVDYTFLTRASLWRVVAPLGLVQHGYYADLVVLKGGQIQGKQWFQVEDECDYYLSKKVSNLPEHREPTGGICTSSRVAKKRANLDADYCEKVKKTLIPCGAVDP